jgi:hypothetical protein
VFGWLQTEVKPSPQRHASPSPLKADYSPLILERWGCDKLADITPCRHPGGAAVAWLLDRAGRSRQGDGGHSPAAHQRHACAAASTARSTAITPSSPALRTGAGSVFRSSHVAH